MAQMMHDKVALEDASDDQLRSFATGYLQLELDDKVTKRAQLLAAIDKAWKNPYVLVEQGVQPSPDQSAKPKPKTQYIGFLAKYRDDPVVELEIGETAYAGGDKPVPVNVNGGNLVIPRGKRYGIPYRFYLALMNAHNVDVRQDPKTLELQFTKTTNYPLTIHSRPSDEQVAAWHERFDNVRLGGRPTEKAEA